MWDNKMKEYEQRAGELLEAMRQVTLTPTQPHSKPWPWYPEPSPNPKAVLTLTLTQPSGTCWTCASSIRRRRKRR